MSHAQKQYLVRQSKDPYTAKAQQMGYRSRAAFKLLELNEKFNLLKPNQTIVDLGAAPGGWCQVVGEILNNNCRIIACDLLEVDPLPNVTFIQGDFTTDEIWDEVRAVAGEGGVDVVLSDMAPNTAGSGNIDHLRSMGLVEIAADSATHLLKLGGHFACKIFQGGEEKKFADSLKERFEKVHFAKPKSSRAESREIFIVALGFKG